MKREGMSAKHCAMIRKCPCAACLIEPAGTIHHLKQGTGERGGAMRSSDRFGVPLCPVCHHDIEHIGSKNERAHFLGWGVDPLRLASDLWAATGNQDEMARIVKEHRP